jgi:flagellar hook-associated protein 2
MDLGVSGLASGFDWKSLIDQLIQVEQAPEQQMRSDQSAIQQRNNAYGSIKTELGVLSNRVTALQDPTLFDSRLAAVTDASVGSATAQTGAALGSYTFTFSQLATCAVQNGAADVGQTLASSADVSSLVLSDANFAKAVTGGTFTVNGRQISIDPSDTLQAVFDKISAATSGQVTASYAPDTDAITLSSANEIVLGSATDTSNFLAVARLENNGGASVSSSSRLGGIRLNLALSSADFATPVSDGGAGAGEFKINGVSIQFSSADSVAAVLTRINNSGAGVTASYDAVGDRFVLASKTTGDMGIALEDVTGNFLAATGLSGGALQRGKNLLYSINGGAQSISHSNTIDEDGSGLAGLAVTAAKEGEMTVTVSSDTANIKTAINDFLTEYNKVQTLISTQTASSTDAQGKVTAGVLAQDSDADDIASRLRNVAFSQISGLPPVMDQLADLGIQTSGNDNSLTLKDEAALDSALSDNLEAVKALFTDGSSGLAVTLSSYLDATIGDDGSLVQKQDTLTKQSADIDTQISDMERTISSDRDRLTNEFLAMEQAQAQTNQQLQFLQQQFGGGSGSGSGTGA